MQKTEIIFTPHVTANIFSKYKIPKTQIALAIDRSYQTVCQVLRGSVRPSPEIDKRLKKYAGELEAKLNVRGSEND